MGSFCVIDIVNMLLHICSGTYPELSRIMNYREWGVFAENLGATLAENLVDSGVIDIDFTANACFARGGVFK